MTRDLLGEARQVSNAYRIAYDERVDAAWWIDMLLRALSAGAYEQAQRCAMTCLYHLAESDRYVRICERLVENMCLPLSGHMSTLGTEDKPSIITSPVGETPQCRLRNSDREGDHPSYLPPVLRV